MSIMRVATPVLCLLAFVSTTGTSEGALYFKTTYCVQVKYEMWRNGSSYWDTEFETTSQSQATLMYELLESAIESGSIRDILNVGFDWIVVDVRIVTKREPIYLPPPISPYSLLFRF